MSERQMSWEGGWVNTRICFSEERGAARGGSEPGDSGGHRLPLAAGWEQRSRGPGEGLPWCPGGRGWRLGQGRDVGEKGLDPGSGGTGLLTDWMWL